MHLQVELYCEFSEHKACSICGVLDTCLLFTVFTGTGSEIQGPYCLPCLETRTSMSFAVEQPELKLGRLPPSRKDKKTARDQERKIAEDIGGRRQPGSGNQAHAKGDVRKKGEFRVEAKSTKSSQFTITRDLLGKINGECSYGEKPVVQIDFVDPTSRRQLEAWVVITYQDWLELIDASCKNS